MNYQPSTDSPPKVSVCMITYNHEKFIGQAIDSVLMQQTNFNYELVIGEDCSTDNTRAIVVEYQKKHPDKIRLLLPEKNLGMHENGRRTLEACHGEYIALLEGDDYWTDPLKLQKQAELLDSDPGIAMCFHDINRVDVDGKPLETLPSHVPRRPIYDVADLLQYGCFITTLSVMYRRKLCPVLPDWVLRLPAGDFSQFLLLAQSGSIRRLEGVWGTYRIHQGGVFRRKGERERFEHNRTQYEFFKKYFTLPKYKQLIKYNLVVHSFGLAQACLRDNDLPASRRYLLLCARDYTCTANIPFGSYLVYSLRAFTPSFYAAWGVVRWYLKYIKQPRHLVQAMRGKFNCD